MKKKIKNSVKSEMKSMVQRELAKIMAKQISNEDSYKEMIQEVINDFYEEEIEVEDTGKENQPTSGNKRDTLYEILSGKYKDRFSALVNQEENNTLQMNPYVIGKNLKNENQIFPNIELTKEQLNTLFKSQNEQGTRQFNPAYFREVNPVNLCNLRGIIKEQSIQDYERIQYTKEVLGKMFDFIEKNINFLEATHEQLHINKNSIETYKVQNKVEKELVNDFNTNKIFSTRLNPEYFSFELEIKTNDLTKQKKLALKNLTMENNVISEGVISTEDVEKLLKIVQEIYSVTTIKPLSQTEPITEEEIRAAKKIKNSQRAKKAWDTIKAKKQVQKTSTKTKAKKIK